MALTLRNKIRVSLLAIVALLSVFTLLFFPARQRASLRHAFENEVSSTAKTVALGVSIGLKSGDLGATQSAFDFAKADARVRLVALISDGSVISSYPEHVIVDDTILNSDTLVAKRADVKTDALKGEVLVGFSTASMDKENSDLTMTAILVTALAIGFGILCTLWLERSIRKPVQRLVEGAERVGSGDLTVNLEYDVNDEIGRLYGAMGDMTERLRETLAGVWESTRSVANASSEISSSTEQMAAGSQEQTSQASEVASAVEEMTKTIIENSKTASATADTANHAKQAAELGGMVVKETVAGMKRIAEVVNKSAKTVKALGKSSDQIGEIIGVIDDIADQTNLLALNAAIEAARAGEQGRGFAVVADEVRKLAERTTKATKEIADMIKTIQHDTAGAVSSMEEGTKQVDEGIRLADKAGSSLEEIVVTSQKVTDMVTQIAAASEQQSSASGQISKNVDGISVITGETAQATQQIARAAEDLNRLTENLQQLVSQFKLSDNSQGVSATRTRTSQKSLKQSGHLLKSDLAVRENGSIVPQL